MNTCKSHLDIVALLIPLLTILKTNIFIKVNDNITHYQNHENMELSVIIVIKYFIRK